MRSRWNTTVTDGCQHLNLHTSGGWIHVGWVQPTTKGFNVLCCWIEGSGEDYPETKIFETAKQARRALKATATVAIIGGFRGN
jgi:hypothetical protein